MRCYLLRVESALRPSGPTVFGNPWRDQADMLLAYLFEERVEAVEKRVHEAAQQLPLEEAKRYQILCGYARAVARILGHMNAAAALLVDTTWQPRPGGFGWGVINSGRSRFSASRMFEGKAIRRVALIEEALVIQDPKAREEALNVFFQRDVTIADDICTLLAVLEGGASASQDSSGRPMYVRTGHRKEFREALSGATDATIHAELQRLQDEAKRVGARIEELQEVLYDDRILPEDLRRLLNRGRESLNQGAPREKAALRRAKVNAAACS